MGLRRQGNAVPRLTISRWKTNTILIKKDISSIFGYKKTLRVSKNSKTTKIWVFMGDILWHILEVDVEYLKRCTKSITSCHF